VCAGSSVARASRRPNLELCHVLSPLGGGTLAGFPPSPPLFRQPDGVELVVEDVGRRDRPAPDLGAMGNDAMLLQRVDVVDLLVETALLEGAQQAPALAGVLGPGLPHEQLAEDRILVAAGAPVGAPDRLPLVDRDAGPDEDAA